MASKISKCPECKKPGRWSPDDEWVHEDLDDALACRREGKPAPGIR